MDKFSAGQLAVISFTSIVGLLSSLVLASWVSYLRSKEAEELEKLKFDESQKLERLLYQQRLDRRLLRIEWELKLAKHTASSSGPNGSVD